jgi:hypothetical protein
MGGEQSALRDSEFWTSDLVETIHQQSQLRSIISTQQGQQARDAVSNGLRTEENFFADLFIGLALGD